MSYLTRVMTGPTPQLEHGKRADLVLLDLWDVEELSLDPEVPVVAQGRAETVTLARLAPPPTNQFPRPPAGLWGHCPWTSSAGRLDCCNPSGWAVAWRENPRSPRLLHS